MRVRLVMVILLVVGLAACGDDTGTAAGGSLTGRTFLSESVTGRELVAGTQIRLELHDDEAAVEAGCNHLFGTLRIDGDRLHVDDMGGTEMGCDAERHEQDTWIMEFLGDGPAYELDGDRLRLSAGEVVLTMLDREVADPDRPLEGTTWVLDGLVEGDAVSSVPATAEQTTLDASTLTLTHPSGKGLVLRAQS